MTMTLTKNVPRHLCLPLDHQPFIDSYVNRRNLGLEILRQSNVAIVGLARNCAGPLYENLHRVEQLASLAGGWKLHIETNDNDDETDDLLEAFAAAHREEASYRSAVTGREQYTTEFAGRRTTALAEYRQACQAWVREHAPRFEFTIVIDWDAWGGWMLDGVLGSLSWLHDTHDAYAMASVSVAQMDLPESGRQWIHYDAWSLRLNSYWDDYTSGHGGWKHSWLPPVGSDPVRLCSAFGGLCIYKTSDYLTGTYDGSDCEHVPFHQSIARATDRYMCINPSQRMLMHWLLDDEEPDGGRDGDD